MFFQWNQCKTIGEGDQDFWNKGPKYEIVENTITWFIFFLWVHLVRRWKSEMIENEQVMEKWRNIKDFNFPSRRLVNWRGGKVE